MMVHELKTWPGPFQATSCGVKTYEIRRADRGYTLCDILVLREWVPPADPGGKGRYTNSVSVWVVSHVTEGGAWGLPADMVVMAIKPLPFNEIRRESNLGRRLMQLAARGGGKLSLADEPDECPLPPPGIPPGRFRFN